MAKVRLRFTTSHSIVSWIIRWCTYSPISHCEFVVENQNGELCTLGANVPGGVQLRPLDYEPKAKIYYGYVTCSDELKAAVESYAFSQIGKPFDLGALFGFLTQRNWQKDDKWYCAELVFCSFMHAGFFLLSDILGKSRITPRDILISPFVELDDESIRPKDCKKVPQ